MCFIFAQFVSVNLAVVSLPSIMQNVLWVLTRTISYDIVLFSTTTYLIVEII